MNEIKTKQKMEKLSGGSEKCPFYPMCTFINKNKEERMRYDYENDENKQKRDNYGDWD